MNDLVWIKTFPDEAAAQRACRLLSEHGVECVVAEDQGKVAYVSLPPMRGYRLGVRADDVRAALELIWGQPVH